MGLWLLPLTLLLGAKLTKPIVPPFRPILSPLKVADDDDDDDEEDDEEDDDINGFVESNTPPPLLLLLLLLLICSLLSFNPLPLTSFMSPVL